MSEAYVNELDQQIRAVEKKNEAKKKVQTVLWYIMLGSIVVIFALFMLSLFGLGLTDSTSFASSTLYRLSQSNNAMLKVTPSDVLSGDASELALADEVLGQSYSNFFDVDAIRLQPDENDPSTLHYTCTIPGPVNAFYEQMFQVDIANDEAYSPRIPMSGVLHVLTDEQGNRRIVLEDGKNPISLKITICDLGRQYRASNGSGSNQDAQLTLAASIGIAYAAALEQPDFVSETVVPQLSAYNEGMTSIEKRSVPAMHNGGSLWGCMHGMTYLVWALLGVFVALLIVVILLGVRRHKDTQERYRLRSERYKEKEELDRVRMIARQKREAIQQRKAERQKAIDKQQEAAEELQSVIDICRKPQRSKTTMHELCTAFDAA